MDPVSQIIGGFFGSVNTGLSTAGTIATANANAAAAQQSYLTQQQANERAFQQQVTLSQLTSPITNSPNFILLVMVGAAVFFVINQANK